MNKFKVGDRVSGIYGKIKGYKGVVVEVDTGIKCDRILCHFKNFNGHNGNGLTKTGKDYNTSDHWYVYPDEIELISIPNETKNRKRRKKNEFFMWTICRQCINDIIRCINARRRR